MSNYRFLNIDIRILAISILAIIISFAFYSYFEQYFSFEYIKSQQREFATFYNNNKTLSVVSYFLLYLVVTALAIPVANIMVVVASAIAGLQLALVISSFAGAFGALFSFLVIRYLFRDYFQKKFSDRIALINKGIQKDGAYYLFALRVSPVVPFFLVNILISLTPMRSRMFFIISQLGMLPDTLILVFIGQQLATVNSLQDAFSPAIIISLTILGVFPLLIKYGLRQFKKDISNV